ncbi:AzlC family ABC transporter permease [Geobacter argillaceus]|uniref:4-azaleucine resistance transporter AzlC n=1 Tax=Geobacter argillaceus TaxID=345631 RepID=A0A562V684_9BACT|nr:AzlC family ABC transporter permease [Geobacter argillaceus]TWJ13312.1 4-azaleucine resistance transporter AzlC [Geobacter argillaceus]
MHTNPTANLRQSVRDGLTAAWPICLGYLPIGFAFGVLAQQAGLGPWHVALMSLFVFAGSSQFIAVAMLAAGTTLLPIVGTTLVVNLRHTLMSSSLAPHLHGAGRRFLALFAYGVTDESYAVNMSRFRDGGWHRLSALTLNHAANLTWLFSTVAGVFAGQLIPQKAFGIDYALTGMFLCLLVFQLRGRIYWVTAIIGGVLSLLFYLILPGNAYVFLAALGAATLVHFLKKRRSRWSAP